jgi:glycosyltransferase involved in cell wall biosynthesis
MKYSIIIPYRNRETHLEVLLPRLQEKFEGQDYEIIISEQGNTDNFQIAIVNNIGFRESRGEVIILHQVDYYPADDLEYTFKGDVTLMGAKAFFLDRTNKNLRPESDIPGGYRSFSQAIDPNFYGGVVMMSREQFTKINGLNPLYKGWGNEDEDLRERLKWANIPVVRQTQGTFFCLYHEDNGAIHLQPPSYQEDFYEGRTLYANAYQYRNVGYANIKYTLEEISTDIKNVKWIKSNNYQINYEDNL